MEVEKGCLTPQFLAWHLHSFLSFRKFPKLQYIGNYIVSLPVKYYNWMTYDNRYLFSHSLEAQSLSIKVWTGLASSGSSEQGTASCLFPGSWCSPAIAGAPWLTATPHQPLPVFTRPPPPCAALLRACQYKFPSYKVTSYIGFRAHPPPL